MNPPNTPLDIRQWDQIMTARMGMSMVVSMLAIRDWFPRQAADALIQDLLRQDAAVRGNRSKDGKPTWGDARLCVEATLRECLAMMKVMEDKENEGS